MSSEPDPTLTVLRNALGPFSRSTRYPNARIDRLESAVTQTLGAFIAEREFKGGTGIGDAHDILVNGSDRSTSARLQRLENALLIVIESLRPLGADSSLRRIELPTVGSVPGSGAVDLVIEEHAFSLSPDAAEEMATRLMRAATTAR